MTTRNENWMVWTGKEEKWFSNGREALRFARQCNGQLWRLVEGSLELQN